MKRLILGCLFLVLMALNASADQTVSNGKWWSSGGSWWYVNSSMLNILVPDGGVSGNVITGNFYRRPGELIVIEEVPDSSHSTGSYYYQDGSVMNFYVYYGLYSDDLGNHGRYLAEKWGDNTNGAWQIMWNGRVCCINLQTSNGQWVCADNGGGSTITANRPAPYAWEEFTLWHRSMTSDRYFGDGDEIVLGTRDHYAFVCAEGGGGQSIVGNRTAVGPWERFIIHKIASAPNTPNDRYLRSGDKVAISAANGQYWSADNGGGGGITANRNGVGDWETFTLQIINPEPH